MTGPTPTLLAQGSQLEGPGRPLLASIAACDSLWVAVRFTPDTVHVFAGGTLRHIVLFPEDVCHLEFGVRSASPAQTQLQGQQVCLLAITEPCRAWMLDPTKSAGASTQTGRGVATTGAPDARAQPSSPPQQAKERLQSSAAAEPLRVEWQVVPAQAGSAPDAPRPTHAPTRFAALLTCAASLLDSPAGPASLAAQIAWEHLADSPSVLPGTASDSGMFLDISEVGRKYSRERHALGGGTVSGLAGACCEGTMPQLSGVTCSLHVHAHASSGVPPTGARDELRCRSRACISPQLYAALLAGGCADTGASNGSCLLAGDYSGKVWAYPLSRSSAQQKTGASSAPPLAAQNSAAADSGRTGPVLLFDIQQPVLSIHAASSTKEACSSGGPPHECLIIIGQEGHVVQVCVRDVSVWPQQQPPASGVQKERAASLATIQMRVHAPVTSAAVSQGVLYYVTGSTARAALLPCAPNFQTANDAGAPAVPAKRDCWHDLQPLPLQCFGQCPHLLSICDPGTSAATKQAPDRAANKYAAAGHGRLVVLCTNGALFEGPLLSAEAVTAVKPALLSSRVQQEVKVMLHASNFCRSRLCFCSPWSPGAKWL